MVLPPSNRRIPAALRSRLLLPALVALVGGIGGFALGLPRDAALTAVGALLFLPRAALPFGIVSQLHGADPFVPPNRQGD